MVTFSCPANSRRPKHPWELATDMAPALLASRVPLRGVSQNKTLLAEINAATERKRASSRRFDLLVCNWEEEREREREAQTRAEEERADRLRRRALMWERRGARSTDGNALDPEKLCYRCRSRASPNRRRADSPEMRTPSRSNSVKSSPSENEPDEEGEFFDPDLDSPSPEQEEFSETSQVQQEDEDESSSPTEPTDSSELADLAANFESADSEMTPTNADLIQTSDATVDSQAMLEPDDLLLSGDSIESGVLPEEVDLLLSSNSAASSVVTLGSYGQSSYETDSPSFYTEDSQEPSSYRSNEYEPSFLASSGELDEPTLSPASTNLSGSWISSEALESSLVSDSFVTSTCDQSSLSDIVAVEPLLTDVPPTESPPPQRPQTVADSYSSMGKFVRQEALDLSFWPFLTFLHHSIEEGERRLL